MDPISLAGQSHLPHTCPVYSSSFRARKCSSILAVWFRPSTKAQQHIRQHFSRRLLEDEIKAMSKGILPEDGSTSLFLDKQKACVHIMEEQSKKLWSLCWPLCGLILHVLICEQALNSQTAGEVSNTSVTFAWNWCEFAFNDTSLP